MLRNPWLSFVNISSTSSIPPNLNARISEPLCYSHRARTLGTYPWYVPLVTAWFQGESFFFCRGSFVPHLSFNRHCLQSYMSYTYNTAGKRQKIRESLLHARAKFPFKEKAVLWILKIWRYTSQPPSHLPFPQFHLIYKSMILPHIHVAYSISNNVSQHLDYSTGFDFESNLNIA